MLTQPVEVMVTNCEKAPEAKPVYVYVELATKPIGALYVVPEVKPEIVTVPLEVPHAVGLVIPVIEITGLGFTITFV